VSHTAPENDPLAVIVAWLDEATAAGAQRNPNAMALATVDPEGRPSARMVLLKHIDAAQGFGVFYTHYGSRKGRDLAHSAHAAAVLYWPEPGRQVRLEGPVTRSPGAESDAYFASRPEGSQLNAWVSEQSRSLTDPAVLDERLQAKRRELRLDAPDGPFPRPSFWGGFRLWFEAIELWREGRDRFHERVRYERDLRARGDSFDAGHWLARRLQP
jgi:pyridoxamine 5'-phosphate oxidase